jgi:hypothetical protein
MKIQFVPHREQVCSHYKQQLVNAVWGNNYCLL